MEKAYFPMFVDISEMKIVVIGGGTIASRRVRTLTQFASDITVIAPTITDSLQQLKAEGRIEILCRKFQDCDVEEADMVLAATDNRELNQHVASLCKDWEIRSGRKILLSVADDRTLCDFYFPAVVKTDEVVIGINSGGADPGRVKQLRKKLEAATQSLRS